MQTLIFLYHYSLIYNIVKTFDNYYRVIIINGDTELEEASLLEYFDRVIRVKDIYNKEEMSNVIAGIKKERNSIRALYSPHEATIEIAGYLRDTFNIPGMNEETSINVRDKYQMKQIIKKHNIAAADSSIVTCKNDIQAFVSKYGYPIVIKPLAGFATINTFKLQNDDDMEHILQKISVTNKELGEQKYLAETFINGEEYYCDSVVSQGQVVFSAVSKYLHNCIDTINNAKPVGGIVFPQGADSIPLISQIKKINEEAVAALGVADSVCHMEVFVDKNNYIYFGEIAARIGGGTVIPPCIQNTYGFDLIKAFVDVEIKKIDFDSSNSKNAYTGFLTFPTAKGQITNISKIGDFADEAGLITVKIYNKAGDVIGTQSSTASRTGYVIMEASSFEELYERLYKAYNKFIIEVC